MVKDDSLTVNPLAHFFWTSPITRLPFCDGKRMQLIFLPFVITSVLGVSLSVLGSLYVYLHITWFSSATKDVYTFSNRLLGLVELSVRDVLKEICFEFFFPIVSIFVFWSFAHIVTETITCFS